MTTTATDFTTDPRHFARGYYYPPIDCEPLPEPTLCAGNCHSTPDRCGCFADILAELAELAELDYLRTQCGWDADEMRRRTIGYCDALAYPRPAEV